MLFFKLVFYISMQLSQYKDLCSYFYKFVCYGKNYLQMFDPFPVLVMTSLCYVIYGAEKNAVAFTCTFAFVLQTCLCGNGNLFFVILNSKELRLTFSSLAYNVLKQVTDVRKHDIAVGNVWSLSCGRSVSNLVSEKASRRARGARRTPVSGCDVSCARDFRFY